MKQPEELQFVIVDLQAEQRSKEQGTLEIVACGKTCLAYLSKMITLTLLLKLFRNFLISFVPFFSASFSLRVKTKWKAKMRINICLLYRTFLHCKNVMG